MDLFSFSDVKVYVRLTPPGLHAECCSVSVCPSSEPVFEGGAMFEVDWYVVFEEDPSDPFFSFCR